MTPITIWLHLIDTGTIHQPEIPEKGSLSAVAGIAAGCLVLGPYGVVRICGFARRGPLLLAVNRNVHHSSTSACPASGLPPRVCRSTHKSLRVYFTTACSFSSMVGTGASLFVSCTAMSTPLIADRMACDKLGSCSSSASISPGSSEAARKSKLSTF